MDQSNKLVLVNGANGSGKTTLLKSVAVLSILAQIGCHVPCESLAFTPFNNMFNYAGSSSQFGAVAESNQASNGNLHAEMLQCESMLT